MSLILFSGVQNCRNNYLLNNSYIAQKNPVDISNNSINNISFQGRIFQRTMADRISDKPEKAIPIEQRAKRLAKEALKKSESVMAEALCLSTLVRNMPASSGGVEYYRSENATFEVRKSSRAPICTITKHSASGDDIYTYFNYGEPISCDKNKKKYDSGHETYSERFYFSDGELKYYDRGLDFYKNGAYNISESLTFDNGAVKLYRTNRAQAFNGQKTCGESVEF